MPRFHIPISYFGQGVGVSVEGVEGCVYLTIEAEKCANADPERQVSFEADEARAVAAALMHFAGELEAGRG